MEGNGQCDKNDYSRGKEKVEREEICKNGKFPSAPAVAWSESWTSPKAPRSRTARSHTTHQRKPDGSFRHKPQCRPHREASSCASVCNASRRQLVRQRAWLHLQKCKRLSMSLDDGLASECGTDRVVVVWRSSHASRWRSSHGQELTSTLQMHAAGGAHTHAANGAHTDRRKGLPHPLALSVDSRTSQ